LTASIPTSALFIPANQFTLHAVRHGRTISLSWPAQSTRGARVKYAVYRADIDQLACGRPPGRAMACAYPGAPTIEIGTTHWLDRPPKGQSVYRVAVVAGAVPPMGAGDYILLSRALTVDMPA
jgi:hypothetical protein